jgi:hypothetical protein
VSNDLSELFARDPALLSDQDIAQIVARMREAQAQYELGAKAPVAERPKKAKSTKTQDLLKDLGLA